MACREREIELSVYLDGELDEERAAVLEAHLHSCGDCRATLEAMAETDRRITDLPFPAPDVNLAERIVVLALAASQTERPESKGIFGFLRWAVRDLTDTLWPAVSHRQGLLEAFSDSPPFFMSRVYFGPVDAAR